MAEFKVGDRVMVANHQKSVGVVYWVGDGYVRWVAEDGCWCGSGGSVIHAPPVELPQATYSTLHREEFERWQQEQRAEMTAGEVIYRQKVHGLKPEPQPYDYIPSAPVILGPEQKPRRDWQADFDRAMRRAKLRRLHESAEAALSTVMPSDVAGMARMPEPAPMVQPLPASTTKAACVGLGVVWSGRGAPVVE